MNGLLTWSVIPALIFYLIGAYQALLSLQGARQHRMFESTVVRALAVGLHGLAIWSAIQSADHISLGIALMLTCVGFAMALVLLLNQLRRPMNHLDVFVFPLSGLSLLLFAVLPATGMVRVALPTPLFIHIILSLLGYSILALAALQALYLALFDRLARTGRTLPKGLALDSIEQMLFESIWLGMIALSLGILTGFAFIDSYDVRGIIHHTFITITAWLIFAVLLWGRLRAGWRGSQAGWWTLAGFGILALGYFGSKLVIEVLIPQT